MEDSCWEVGEPSFDGRETRIATCNFEFMQPLNKMRVTREDPDEAS